LAIGRKLRAAISLQIALSFDEEAMDVLNWLDEYGFKWNTYVDLPTTKAGTSRPAKTD
jgi:hypothetical protein